MRWLRRQADAGDLRAQGAVGLRDLQGRLGYAFAPEEIRARFDASREALEGEGRGGPAPARGGWVWGQGRRSCLLGQAVRG